MAELHPGLYWTVYGRMRKRDPLERCDSYDTEEVAIEMATELYQQYDWFEVIVRDYRGEEVKRFVRKQ